MRQTVVTVLAIASIAGTLGLAAVGCSGSESGTETSAPLGETLPADLLAKAWPIKFAKIADQNAFTGTENDTGWVQLVVNRNLKIGSKQLDAKGGLGGARGHAEDAALYRQALVSAAWSYINTYGERPAESDPIGTAHVLTVSYVVIGDLAKAREQSARLDAFPDDPTQPWHAPWKAWLASGDAPVWPPDLSSLPMGDMPAPAPGEWPEALSMPHYTLQIANSTSPLALGDPAALLVLSMWHEKVAKDLAGDQSAAVDTYLERYRLPIEFQLRPPADTAAPVDLPPEFLFGSDFLAPEDGPFVAALMKDGPSAVDAWSAKSPLAWLAAKSRVEGKIDAQKGVDMAADLRKTLLTESEKANGELDGSHRTFADIAQVGTLRILALVAEVEGDREASGILRINAWEKTDGPTGCPVALMSMAAHDSQNGYPLRAADILHNAIKRYPSLEAARYGTDVLGLRISQEAPAQPPGG